VSDSAHTTHVDVATLAALADFPARLESFYAAVPHSYANWRPETWTGIPSEPFTPLEQICHVRDIEIDGYHARFARTLREIDPVLANIDGESLARQRAYSSDNAERVFDAFRMARARTLATIAAFTAQDLARHAHFDGHTTTLRGLVHNLCSHDQQHLAGLQWLLARMPAARA
jgi:hypothetical protein